MPFDNPALEKLAEDWDDESSIVELVNNAYRLGLGKRVSLYEQKTNGRQAEVLDALEASQAQVARLEAEVGRLRPIVEECVDWHVQPFAGANSECYFCGNLRGMHDADCFSERARKALAASTDKKEADHG